MRRWLPLAGCLGLAAVVAAVAVAAGGGEARAKIKAVAAGGDFSVSNSSDGMPVFGAEGIGPGGSARGTVEIADSGGAAARLVLERGDLLDTPGAGGGLLSSQLLLRVEDVTEPANPVLVYSGPLDSMPPRQTGRLEPGEARAFEFTATLPDTGTAGEQNGLQGAATEVAYAWTASEVGEEEPGGGGGSGGEGEQPGASVPHGGGGGGAEAPSADGLLDLTVSKIRRALRRGHLVAWVNCDEACRLSVRGRLRGSATGVHRAARIRFARQRLYAPGPRRLRIPVPGRLRHWLRRELRHKRLRARLSFVAVGIDGQRDAVRRTVRLRTGRRGRCPRPIRQPALRSCGR